MYKIQLKPLKFFMVAAFLMAPTFAFADSDKRKTARDLGYIAGSKIRGDDNGKDVVRFKDGKRRQIFGTKKLFENDDVIVYRGFDTKGKRYTITKRK